MDVCSHRLQRNGHWSWPQDRDCSKIMILEDQKKHALKEVLEFFFFYLTDCLWKKLWINIYIYHARCRKKKKSIPFCNLLSLISSGTSTDEDVSWSFSLMACSWNPYLIIAKSSWLWLVASDSSNRVFDHTLILLINLINSTGFDINSDHLLIIF